MNACSQRDVKATHRSRTAALPCSGPCPRIHAILAEVDGSSVGLALFYYSFNTFKARPNIFLEDLFVDPAHRGTGIGLALMRHLAQRALAENCRRIEWRVLNWNQPSIDFYRAYRCQTDRHLAHATTWRRRARRSGERNSRWLTSIRPNRPRRRPRRLRRGNPGGSAWDEDSGGGARASGGHLPELGLHSDQGAAAYQRDQPSAASSAGFRVRGGLRQSSTSKKS